MLHVWFALGLMQIGRSNEKEKINGKRRKGGRKSGTWNVEVGCIPWSTFFASGVMMSRSET